VAPVDLERDMANKSVVVDGLRLAVELSGTGPPVLLIAGTGMPRAAWELLGAQAMRDAGFQVISFDNRGVGGSDGPPGPYSVEAMAADVAGLITALEVGPVHVLGLSLGGSVAQYLTASRPDLVRAVVLWAATGRSPVFFRRLLAVESEIAEAMPLPASWHLWQYLLISLRFDVLQNDDTTVDAVAALLSEGVQWSGDGRAGQFAADVAWDSADHSDLYTRIRCPCLVVAHEYDLVYPPAAARRAADAMPAGRFVEIPGVAHGQALDASPVVLREAIAFFAEHASAAR
jgi:pimeloyl-ACP methyl ester carboxylesterase